MTSPAGAEVAAAGERRDEHPELLGPFRIHGILGRGGMGVVFDAATPAGQRVALKVIRPQAIDPEQAHILVARFHREAKILQQMNHPGVVRLVDAGEVEGTLYLAMERIEGVSLLAIRRRGPLGFDALVQLGIQLADALQHLHEAGVIHRDIKPANILINAQGQPVITDFGISGMSEATGITRMGDLLGSPGFMAPEVTEGAPPTELSDQFALGRLLYELGATGPAKKLPRNAPILQILSESLEIDWNRFPRAERWPALEPILRRMLATEPLERFPNASAARAALLALTSSDLLDLDTLSEHIGALGVAPRMSWDLTSSIEAEVDVAAIEARAPAPPSAPPAPPLASSWASAIGPAPMSAGSEDVTVPPPAPPPPRALLRRDEAPTIPPETFEALRRNPNDTIPEPIPASVLGAIIEQHVVVRTKSDASAAAEPRDTRPDPPARVSASWPDTRASEPRGAAEARAAEPRSTTSGWPAELRGASDPRASEARASEARA
ncbi:serine/threonine protein kinase, partial [Myxococcota bacterium]|nr:serine/threonine protein kinase [Myxococcota bacterium]